MPTTSKIAYYAMYVIGEVESGWNWSSINYNDPITVGMMQWFGTRAAGLLNRVRTELPSYYTQIAQSLRSDLESHDASSTYWTTRYLTSDEGKSIAGMFAANATHIVQENQAIEDFTNYIPTMENWGASTSAPQALIFCMAMYHQGPLYCQQVMQSSNPQNLDSVYAACMANSVLGQYKTRYNTVYARCKAWDGESDPPDFGQTGQGGNDPTPSPDLTSIKSLTMQGNTLRANGRTTTVLYKNASGGYDGGGFHAVSTGNVILLNNKPFYYTGNSMYVGKYNTPTPEPPTPLPTNVNAATVDWGRQYLNQWSYIYGGSRTDPASTGGTDCSGFVIAAYWQVRGIVVGSYTGSLWTSSLSDQIYYQRGGDWNAVPWDSLQAGDILLMSSDSYYFTSGGGSHTGLYTGTPYYFIDCGSTPCPKERAMTWYNAIAIGVVRPKY